MPTSLIAGSTAGTAYRYRAARPDGTIERGSIHAANPGAAHELIALRGYWILDLRPDITGVTRRGLSHADLGLGLRTLASLIESGIPLSHGLSVLDDLVPESWHVALPVIRAAVQRGESLASALASASVGVPAVVTGVIQAGESGSGLAAAVRRAATLMEDAAARRAAVLAALAYPLILAIASTASVALLVGVVLPRFAAILTDLGQALPPTTRLVLAVAEFTRRGALPGALTLAVCAIAWYAWVTSVGGRAQWDGWLLTLPTVGAIRCSVATAGWTRALSALLESGVPIAPALRSAADAAGDAAIAQRVLRARERIVHGAPIADSLAAERAATPTTTRLVRAGETSGRLAEFLAHAATLEQERADRTIKAAVRALEPALILAFGGIVAFVAAALLQAVYSVRPAT